MSEENKSESYIPPLDQAVSEELLACQLSSWYPIFSAPVPGRKKGVTFSSRVVNAPAAFLTYLGEDGVRVPENTKPSSLLGCLCRKPDDVEEEEAEKDDELLSNEVPSVDWPSPELEALTIVLQDAIDQLGGSVLPKLNWSAPQDAVWINQGTMECRTAADVYLLLKSSDFCSSDLEMLHSFYERERIRRNPGESDNTDSRVPIGSTPLQICLREWCNLYPSQEFRCFVRDHNLIGISQRHSDQFFPHLVSQRNDMFQLLEDFFHDHVQHRYAKGQHANYVWDAYVDRKDQVWLVDFNIWSDRTDPLLFSWDELRGRLSRTQNTGIEESKEYDDKIIAEGEDAEFRIVETECGVRAHPLSQYRAPVDTVQLASITQATASLNGGQNSADINFQAFIDLCRAQQEEDDEGDGDEKEDL